MSGRTLRILHVSEVTWGGVVTLVEHFTAEQLRAGHEVHLLAPDNHPGVDPGVVRHPWSVRRRRPDSVPGALSALRRAVRDVRPDVVHLHSFVAGQLGRAPLVLRGRDRVPIVYQPHAWSDRLFRHRAAAAAVRRAESAATGRTDLLVTNCQAELDRGHEIGVDRPGHVLGVAVDLDHLRPGTEEERRAARASLGIGDELAVLVLGRIAWQKGQDLLVEAWEAARPEGMVAYLVGPGDAEPLATAAPTTWGRSIRAVGGTDDIRTWLWACDALLLPSRYETVALVVAEAMACGVPVVAADVDGPAEVLLEGAEPPAGSVRPLGDVTGLIDELEVLRCEPELARAMGDAGVRRAHEAFAPVAVASRLESAYRDAIDRHGTHRGARR